jgi:hypothetical protein
MQKHLAPLLSLSLCLGAQAQSLPPFGENLVVPKPAIKAAAVKPVELDALGAALAASWSVENPKTGETAPPFAIKDSVLEIAAGKCEPGRTTVRVLLPGDAPANGAVWAKSQANFVTFLVRASQPAEMTFHLLQRGKSAGTYQAGFSVRPGEWERVILPLADFKLKSFSSIAGLGLRVAKAEAGATIQVKDIGVSGMKFTDDSWKTHRLSISLTGDWKFATDPGEQGMAEKWFDPKFNDSAWQTLKSGLSWQEQGVTHYGYGWYRQQVFIPKEYQGVPLTVSLSPVPSDDDAWFNGKRIGGIQSEYKYKNLIQRAYTVPPADIRYGEVNSIVTRIWGGNLTFIGNKSGLIKGTLAAEFDPYRPLMKAPDGPAVPYDLFDLSEAQRGLPFEIVFPFPAEVAPEPGARLSYRLVDFVGQELAAGKAPLTAQDGRLAATVAVNREVSQALYFRGRFRASLQVEDAAGNPVYSGTRELDHLSFTKRDEQPLPALAETLEDTPYGKLRLVDEIDASTSTFDDPHPYLQGGFNNDINHMTPGCAVAMHVREILGKKARESEYGWFAYRVGRGKLKPRGTYLLRIEYPEDKPRFAPIEIQTGQNFMDVGWKNGVAPDDVYDNWPLTNQWQWYDVVVPLDDQTVGTGGTGSAPAENGVWVYFMNKQKPGAYYAMWSGGPAVARIRLYEIDAEKHAPVINKPEGLPQRVLSFDWERQPDHNPADLVRYAKLMGYNAISPVIIKWFFANYSDPLNGYDTMVIDDHDYWAHLKYDPAAGQPAASPIPKNKSQHARYLETTKAMGINYIPRFEWGGSADLPVDARAVDVNGAPAKPNRFAPWCANLLDPRTFDDLKLLMDHLIKPYAKDNPQLTGALWRIRCDRLPISYGKSDLELFAKETGTPLPSGGEGQWAAWAAGEGRAAYDDWWHRKRAEFHGKLAELMRGYRPDLQTYYYNWDPDKFGIIEPDITAWGFVANVVKPAPEGGRAAYEKERAVRKTFTARDYIAVMHSGNFGKSSKGINRADYGIRPSLYKDIKGFEIFAPANYLCYADKPEYLNYFQTHDGLAVSNVVSYDEIGARTINPKYEGNMITPGSAPFSMALELLSYFHGDARTLNYTVYTYGRGYAEAHRRFAQAYLALPALPAQVVDQGDPEVKLRTYASPQGTYVGLAYRGYTGKKLTLKVPAPSESAKLIDLVTNTPVPAKYANGELHFTLDSGPMELNAFLVK